jgi:long-chain acyl-CoA synthetase
VYEGERTTFEGFARASLVLAHALAAEGVAKGDHVVLATRNLPEWPVVLMATLLVGAVATPLNAWGTGAELLYGLNDSRAVLAVLDGERWDRVGPLLDEATALRRVLLTRIADGALPELPDGCAAGLGRLSDLIGPTAAWADLPVLPLPVVDLQPDDDATLFYTSGTTGQAKGVLQTHRCATSTLMAGAFSTARSFLRRGEPLPDPAARLTQPASLIAIPLFHTTGCHATLFRSLHNGSKLVLMHHWDPVRAMQLIEAERITLCGGVPTIAWQLIEHPDRPKYDLSSLEAVAYGGAPASAALVARIREVFPQAQPGMGWGMTETTATFTHHSAEDYLNRPDSAGPGLPVGEMRITDDDGRVLLAGQVGELWVKGPNVARGYWQRPEETARTFVDGWLRTGDIGYLDDEGFLYIVDRKKDMLIRGGENIYCAEVEAVLYRHPAVMDAGVVGQAHATLGEEPAAVVSLKPGMTATEDELRAFVRTQLAGFKVPVRVLFVADGLPRNPSGKLLKLALKALLAASPR